MLSWALQKVGSGSNLTPDGCTGLGLMCFEWSVWLPSAMHLHVPTWQCCWVMIRLVPSFEEGVSQLSGSYHNAGFLRVLQIHNSCSIPTNSWFLGGS